MPNTNPQPTLVSQGVTGTTRILKYSPRVPNGALPAVVVLSGWPGSDTAWTAALAGYGSLIAPLLARGFTCYEPFTGSNWGHQTATSPVTNGSGLAAVTDAITAITADGFFGSGKINLYGVSMGALNALTYTMLNPTKVNRVFVATPVFSIASIHAANAGAYQASIQGCYGGASWLANSILRDPYRQNAQIDAVASKIQIRASTDDTVIDWSLLQPWAAARGIKLTSGTGGHALWYLDSGWNDSTVTAWMLS